MFCENACSSGEIPVLAELAVLSAEVFAEAPEFPAQGLLPLGLLVDPPASAVLLAPGAFLPELFAELFGFPLALTLLPPGFEAPAWAVESACGASGVSPLEQPTNRTTAQLNRQKRFMASASHRAKKGERQCQQGHGPSTAAAEGKIGGGLKQNAQSS